jgi:RNA polymerase sigma-70 factor (ECF subfamily)
MKYREIAEITGHSISNVGFLLHTGLKRLREMMKDDH